MTDLAVIFTPEPSAPFVAWIPCPPAPVTDPMIRIVTSPPLAFEANMPVPLEANTVSAAMLNFPVPLFDA